MISRLWFLISKMILMSYFWNVENFSQIFESYDWTVWIARLFLFVYPDTLKPGGNKDSPEIQSWARAMTDLFSTTPVFFLRTVCRESYHWSMTVGREDMGKNTEHK